jgi:hypothetical protein
MQDPTWEECKIAALMNVCDSDVCMCLRGNALLACVHVFMCGYIYIYIYIYIWQSSANWHCYSVLRAYVALSAAKA